MSTRHPPRKPPNAALAEKCARAKGLMEEAQRLIVEVLEDPEYSQEVLPRGVVVEGVEDMLQDAIGSLMEEGPEWDDDDPAPPGGSGPRLMVVRSTPA